MRTWYKLIQKFLLGSPAVLLAEEIDWVGIALEDHIEILDVEPPELSQHCRHIFQSSTPEPESVG
jgi:hypothetical protein